MSQKKQNIAVFGGTSYLAQHACRQLASRGHSLVLVARNQEKLAVVEDDLKARGATVSSQVADLDDISGHIRLCSGLENCDSFWFFYGSLPDQDACQVSWQATEAAFHTNCTSVLSLLTHCAQICETRNGGSLVVVSSVAGDRGRASNYVYGAAKGAVSLFCDGLRARLNASGVQVLLAKPGFFVSPMTEQVEKKPAVLWVDASKVASDIVAAWIAGKDVIYTPWFWRPIMRVIRELPTFLFKRLSL